MFQCAMCKKHFELPAMTNIAGSFCADCKAEWNRRKNFGTRNRRPMMPVESVDEILEEENHHPGKPDSSTPWRPEDLYGSSCRWCGEEINESNPPLSSCNACIHQSCDNHRDWLLKCIRYSDWAARYVVHRERREKPRREAIISNQPSQIKAKPESSVIYLGERLDRLETVVVHLLKELGVDVEENPNGSL
jgi:hypothetical protein